MYLPMTVSFIYSQRSQDQYNVTTVTVRECEYHRYNYVINVLVDVNRKLDRSRSSVAHQDKRHEDYSRC